MRVRPIKMLQPDTTTLIQNLNTKLKELGMLEIALVNPNDCIPSPVNARYFLPEVMRQLIDNVKGSGHLESVPLVYRKETHPGKFFMISGNHRIDAAKAAALPLVLVLVAEVTSDEQVISKQLAHNALVGKDDPVILAELFESIQDVQMRLATGLSDAVSKISYPSLNFKLGATRQVLLMFVPEDVAELHNRLDELEEHLRALAIPAQADVVVVQHSLWDRFADAMRIVKKRDNIKSNSAAFLYLLNEAHASIEAKRARDHEQKCE